LSGPQKGRGGRPPTPTERKRKLGNPGKRPLPEQSPLKAVAPVDSSVADLTVEQAVERSIRAGHWLAESDALSVVMLREAMEFYVDLRHNPQARPADVLAAMKQVGSFGADCGFTPGERARLGLAEVTARSKLDEIAARRKASGD
jgi:hypothetical protein